MTDLSTSTAVVTGGGSGIGRALAVALAAAGAEVVVSDIDAVAAANVAEAVGGLAIPGDLADPEFPSLLISAASEHLGHIDLFFSNAGIDSGFGTDAADATWQRAIEINLLAHTRLVRALLPAWVAAGRGHLVLTASAAGLLTMVGNAPYSVTKHAAVAYAEWLAIEHGADGITVQALCPQGVNTPMLPASGPVRDLLSHDRALEPEEVAQYALEALGSGEFLVLPHPEVSDYYRARATDTDRWLGGMRHLRRHALGAGPIATATRE